MNTSIKQIFTLTSIVMSLFVFSCAKQPTGVRTVKQTQSAVVNPNVSNPSVQAAGAQNILYLLNSIELPLEGVDGTFTVTSEIKTPAGLFIPVTTTHTASQPDAYGVINDESNGVKLDIRTRCISGCEKYVMLVTVVKNNYSVHQMIAISNRSESFFHLENINAAVAGSLFYTSIDQVLQRNSSL